MLFTFPLWKASANHKLILWKEVRGLLKHESLVIEITVESLSNISFIQSFSHSFSHLIFPNYLESTIMLKAVCKGP